VTRRKVLQRAGAAALAGLSLGRVAALDQFGYVPASKAGAELLFDVIALAYERSSVILRTNLPSQHWTEVLGSERLTGAALDRLTHRCPIVETTGESYRLQDAKRRRRSELKS
jgi:DNA replication protein DnaC